MLYENGSKFSSESKEILESFGKKGNPTTINSPQEIDFEERTHFVIINPLHAIDLPSCPYGNITAYAILQAVAWELCSTYHTSIQASPGQLAL